MNDYFPMFSPPKQVLAGLSGRYLISHDIYYLLFLAAGAFIFISPHEDRYAMTSRFDV